MNAYCKYGFHPGQHTMAKPLDEIAAGLRDRVIELDGLGDFGTARAESVRLLAHDLEDALAIVKTWGAEDTVRHHVVERLVTAVEGVIKRLERLERVYLPPSSHQAN